MTHTPHNPIISLLAWAFILLFISGLPTLYVSLKIHTFNASIGKAAALLLVPMWGITWAKASWLTARHSTLQREAARANDCLGYGNGAAMPDRCYEAMQAPGVVPDGFYFWFGAALAFGLVGILIMLGEGFVRRYVDFSSKTVEQDGWFWFIDRRPTTVSISAWVGLGLLGPTFLVAELWSFAQMDAKITVPLFGLQATLAVGWLLFCLYRATRRGVVGVRERKGVAS